jgi:pSer/pThr/pTyr-binding forkhead associated (FHA) protein
LNQREFAEVAVSDRQKVTAYLVYGLGDGREQIVIWDTREVEVGRSKSQDIMLSDPEVSREHTLFRKDGERYTVQDRGTGLGTLVNGERISSAQELQPGDVVRIGPLELKFGSTTQPIRPGGNVRYASELKASQLAVGAGAAGRTMLAFKPEDDLALGAPTAPPTAAPVKKRAVSFDGTFEDIDGDDPLGVEDYDAFIAGNAPVRDLDKEFEAETRAPAAQAAASRVPPAPPSVETREVATPNAPAETAPRPAAAARCTREMVLELEGPPADLEATLAALLGKWVEVPPIKLRIKDPSAR